MCENYVLNNNKNASNIYIQFHFFLGAADDDVDLFVYVLLGGFGGKSKL
jgi:hypothetical protein